MDCEKQCENECTKDQNCAKDECCAEGRCCAECSCSCVGGVCFKDGIVRAKGINVRNGHINAQRITLTNGNNQITLAALDNGAGIWLGQDKGMVGKKPLIAIYSIGNQTCIGMYDHDHKDAHAIDLGLAVGPDGKPFIQAVGSGGAITQISADQLREIVRILQKDE